MTFMTPPDRGKTMTFSLVRLKRRFPYVDTLLSVQHAHDHDQLVAHIAQSHDITLLEAYEEFSDFLFTETLCREVADRELETCAPMRMAVVSGR